MNSTLLNSILTTIDDPVILEKILNRIRATKINVLLIGGTGAGKSSTINALFQDYGKGLKSQAKVGQTSNPQTMDVKPHELDNLVIWDTPGLGDSTEKDQIHQSNIIEILQKKDLNGQPLIDLVFLVLDAGSRDFSSAYTLIKEVVLPNLDENDRKCLLIGINKADMALSNRHWNKEESKPEPKLIVRLEEQVQTVKSRIKAETGLDVEPIYFSAGYKDEDEAQRPYNLQKLLSFIMERLPEKKRASISTHINQDQTNFQSNDGQADYDKKVTESIRESIFGYAKEVLEDAYGKAKEFVTDPEVIKAGAKLLADAAAALLAKAAAAFFKTVTTKGM